LVIQANVYMLIIYCFIFLYDKSPRYVCMYWYMHRKTTTI